jgi:hypothetical protein
VRAFTVEKRNVAWYESLEAINPDENVSQKKKTPYI